MAASPKLPLLPPAAVDHKRTYASCTLVCIASLMGLAACSHQDPAVGAAEVAAESAAQAWLRLLDTGDYAQSWDTAALYFRHSVEQSQWLSRASAVRGPLGGVKSDPDGQWRVSGYYIK